MITYNVLKKADKTGNFFDSITKMTGERLKKYNKKYEYEIKLNTDKKMSLYAINKMISDLFEKEDYCYINRVERYTDYNVDYFLDMKKDYEYSVFLYEGKIMLKIKKHEKKLHSSTNIFKSSEQFVYDGTRILEYINSVNLVYMGSMRKERVKDFIIDFKSGFVYASAVSLCTVNGREQKQYELEYYGDFLSDDEKMVEEDILHELHLKNMLIKEGMSDTFVPSQETKLEFLSKNGLPQDKKEYVIMKIKKQILEGDRTNVQL